MAAERNGQPAPAALGVAPSRAGRSRKVVVGPACLRRVRRIPCRARPVRFSAIWTCGAVKSRQNRYPVLQESIDLLPRQLAERLLLGVSV